MKKLLMLCLLLAWSASSGAIRNMKVLTDNTPDWTDIQSAAKSITGAWATDEQKAIALWKWVAVIRHQVSPAHDSFSNARVPSGHPTYGIIYNPIKLANNYGNTFCVSTNSIPACLWKALGKNAQEHDINGHTVCDLQYGSAWHNFDPAFGFYYRDKTDGHILGTQEVINRHATAVNMTSDPTFVNVLDLTKTNGSIYEGKRVSAILNDPSYGGEYSSLESTRSTLFTETYTDSYTYKLHLKPYESYTRRFTQIDSTNFNYYLPASGAATGAGSGNPNLVNTNKPPPLNISSNGIWVFEPDLSNAKADEAFSRKTTGEWVYRVDGANIICHAVVSGAYSRPSASDSFVVYFSADSVRWIKVYTGAATGSNSAFSQPIGASGSLNLARWREFYYLKFVMQGAANLTGLNVTTYTIVNQRTIPRLTMGSNRVKFLHNGGTVEPFEIVYYWTEVTRNGTASATAQRTFKKTVSTDSVEFYVNAGGNRSPVTDSLTIRWPGAGAAAAEGYNDGIDVGAGNSAPRYYYTFGKNVAVAKSCVSTPTVATIANLTDNQGGSGALMASYAAGTNPEVTVDLGSAQNVSGVRVLCAVGSGNSDYLDSAQLFTSTDNSTFAYQGSFFHSQVWEPITNYLTPNTWDGPPANMTRKCANMLFSKFSRVFDNGTVAARYVRLKCYNSAYAAVIQEFEVYDQMTSTLVENELDHGFALPDLRIAVEKGRIAGRTAFALTVSPNPLHSLARISVEGLRDGHTAFLTILGIDGRVVEQAALDNTARVWNAAALPPGVYVAKVRAGSAELFRKVVILR